MNEPEASVIVDVEVDPATAFAVFTREAKLWWRGDRSLWGPDVEGAMSIEPGVGGRLLLAGDREVGRVTVWEPGPRLAFSYGPDGTDRTEVDVRFEATDEGTRVVLRHRGWETEPDRGHWATVLAGFAKQSAEHAILRRLGQFLDAIGNADLPFFERNLTDDCLMIFPGPDHTYTKAQCIADMSDHPPYVKYDVVNPRVVHSTDTTTVLTHDASIVHTANTEPMNVVVSTVFVKQDGSWRLALLQWTSR